MLDSVPAHRGLYYGGHWHQSRSNGTLETFNPATGESLGYFALATAPDVDAAVDSTRAGFKVWRRMRPLERGAGLKEVARIVREHTRELAMIDATNCGNPFSALVPDGMISAAILDYFPGLVTEIKGMTRAL